MTDRNAKFSHPCKQCGKVFPVFPARLRQGKGNYCSKACAFLARKSERRELQCKKCGVTFEAAMDHGKWPIYCSKACFGTDAIRPADKNCLHCGKGFTAIRSTNAKSDDGRRLYCSVECKDKDYDLRWNRDDGTVMVQRPRMGFACKYALEHRAVAATALGRELDRNGEPIIHIDGNRSNNAPGNIYVCGDRKELWRIKLGELPWPEKSNLPSPTQG